MAHRMLLCAGLSEGVSRIRNVDLSQDILATIDCLRALGAEVTYENRCATVRGTDLRREISSGEETAGGGEAAAVLPCRECGSTLRFMIPLCLMDGRTYALSGSERLLVRPLTVYEKICREQGLVFVKERESLRVSGTLAPGTYEIPGNVSSQFISGLLFVLPLLDKDSRICLIPPVESRPYIEMTLQAMEYFGVEAVWEDALTIAVRGGQKYRARDGVVEGDFSNAAFYDALNVAGGDVTVEGLAERSLQGDRVYRLYFDKIAEGFAEIDLTDCPDLGPVLMALAAMRHGARFTGTARLRLKESDRGEAMKAELEKCGAAVEVGGNEIVVTGGVRAPAEVLQGHNDHRIVMALAVLLTRVGGTIDGAEAVRKSLPDFWERLCELGIEVHKV